jgi:hypothetical protein
LAQEIFNSAVAAIGGLYLTTHSIAVTLIGAGAGVGAGIAATGWTMWLDYRTMSTTGTEPTALNTGEIGHGTGSAQADAIHRQATPDLGTATIRRAIDARSQHSLR